MCAIVCGNSLGIVLAAQCDLEKTNFRLYDGSLLGADGQSTRFLRPGLSNSLSWNDEEQTIMNTCVASPQAG